MRMLTALATTALLAAPLAASADALPADAMPLSEVLAALEQRENISYFTEIEWDDDGYWEIEFRSNDDDEIEIQVDPVTGERRD